MNIMNRHIILSLAIACFANVAFAQNDLTKEITIETDYKPTEQKATKLNKLPNVSKSETTATTLKYSEWASPTDVPATAPLMMPYKYKTAHDFSTKRGYLDLSAGSLLNLTGSAGYQIIDKEKTSLNLWLQHNSTWAGRNKSSNLPSELPEALKQKFNNNIIGLNLSHSLYQGTFTASAFFHFDKFNYYGGYNSIKTTNADGSATYNYNTDNWDTSDYEQSVNEFQAKIGWANRRNDNSVQYSADLLYNYFGFSKGIMQTFNNKANSDNNIRLSLFGESAMSHEVRVGANASIDYVGRKYHSLATDSISESSTRSFGIVALSPYVKIQQGNFNSIIGINVHLSFNDGTAFRFSPNIELGYKFTDGFTFYANAKGGKQITTLRDMYSHNRYINPNSDFSNTYTPLDAEGGFKIGPFTGFYAKLFGGYGIFKDTPMPTLYGEASTYTHSTTYTATELKGWKMGAELGYKFRSIAEAKLNVTYSPQDFEKGYFMGFDRAKFVGNLSVTVTPIERLKIGVDYQLRCKRWVCGTATDGTAVCGELGDVSNLNVDASYQINSIISVFAQANNLLDKRWDNYYGMSAQSINILGGISVIF